MSLKNMILVAGVLVVSMVVSPLAGAAPTVYIQPCVAHDPAKDIAYVKPDKNNEGSAKFMAKVSDSPVANQEIIIEGPVLTWRLTPTVPNVSIDPTVGDSTVMSLSGAEAWDKLYTLSVTATWIEVNKKTGKRVAVTASDSITVSSSKK